MNFRNRTTLWLVLLVALVMLWDNWKVFNGGTSLFFGSSAKQEQPQTARAKRKAERVQAVKDAQLEAEKKNAPSKLIDISTDLVSAQIDVSGGVIKYLELLKYPDTKGDDPTRGTRIFDTVAPRTYMAQTGLIGGDFPNHKSAYVLKSGPLNTDNDQKIDVVFESVKNQVKLIKTFTFERGSYVIGVKHEVVNMGKTPIDPSVYLQLVRDGDTPEGESKLTHTFTGPAVYTDAEKFDKIDFDDVEEGDADHAHEATDGWFAMVQHHFVSAFVPADLIERKIYTRKVDENLYAVGNILPLGTLAPGEKVSTEARLFAGPQESFLLEKTAVGLDLVKDYGWVTIVAKPVYWLLAQIQKVISNWGWSIIALTVLIKLLFAPLSAASYRSMANMKECQPKIKDIRDRYKDDKQQMNAAVMALYKEEKINPLGGCLPVVIQIPVFIALYWVLLASVEIVNAPWIGWIVDLSVPDPYFILPILMAGSMFVQQRMSPPPPDPLQAKIMMAVPVVFSVMFFFFPSGLVLYWVVNNVLSVSQQWWINKRHEAKRNQKKNANKA